MTSPGDHHVRLNTSLYAWDADRSRRFPRLDEAPFDDEGEDLLLFDGMDLDPKANINLRVPKGRVLPDFLYSPLLKLFVSERARGVIEKAHIPGVTMHPVVLRDRSGWAIEDSYTWLNIRLLVLLLDRPRSTFTDREGGGIKKVSHLIIRQDQIPEDEIFLFKELNLAIFSGRLVKALQEARVTGAVFESLDGLTWPT